MNYVSHLNLFGVEAKEIPCITASGAPTTSTVGAVGLLYMNTDNGDVYKCIGVNGSTYNWELFETSSQNSGGNVDQVSVEPEEDDIPKIFFGGALQQTKDEAVVPFRYISKTEEIIGFAEIKAQGNSSMSYPKKNQTVKMYKDVDCTEKLKADFKGWGKQNKHVYKANWIDLSHARNVVSARLWADVVKTRANYADLPELFRTSPNQGAVDGFPVKVYAAGVYQGRYTLNIPKDKWTFNMDDELDNHCVLCGENYYSGCFRAAAKIDESDWTDEIHDVVPESIKTRWNEVISFVMNSTDEEFKTNLSQYFYVDSLIDYYLFGLASCGLDAFGKNQIYATYDGQKWIASMYDMDSTWGLYWNGSKFVATDYARTSYEDFTSAESAKNGNLLYIRLEQLFWSELQTRWAELKNGALSIENIINRFERFTDIAPAELVKEDYASTTGGGRFTGIPSQTTNNIQQIRAFALARQAWTDEYVAGLTPEVEVPCTGISLNTNTLTFSSEGSQTLTATVTPDGCTDEITWESDNTSVATVNGGVVTAIANGSATITAKCGEYSASCSVSVSGIAEGESGGDVSEELTWTATPEYKLNSSGELIAGDGYVSDMFTVEKGYSYSFSDGIPGAKAYVQMVLYNDDGTLAYYGEETGTQYANLLDDGTISKARLTVYADAGAVDLSTVKLVKHGIWSSSMCNINGITGDITVNNGKRTDKDKITLTKIPVESGKTYRLSGKDGDTSTWKRIVVYDADGTMIQNTEGKNTTDALELTMPDNAAYVRCSVFGGGDANEFIEFAEVT